MGMGTPTSTTGAARGGRGARERILQAAEELFYTRGIHATGVAALMEDGPDRSVILVSDPFHMLRLAIVARRLGLTPYCSPTRTSPIAASRDRRWRYVLSESIKVPLAFILERK